MIELKKIDKYFYNLITRWHKDEKIFLNVEPKSKTFKQLHQKIVFHNYSLWHLEDKARVVNVSDKIIADVKRKIDKQNQLRNDTIELIDDYIDSLEKKKLKKNHILVTETPGSVMDRLVILNLKIYHMKEETVRTDVDDNHIKTCKTKVKTMLLQKMHLLNAGQYLLDNIFKGNIKHITYRQFKMYNDPNLNPELYKKK